EGIYAVIDFHPDPGDYYMKDALDFWKRIAERYKDRENVIFELINEPSFDLGRSGYSDQLMRDFEELWHLCDEISPDTPIIVLTLAHVGKRDWQTPVEAAERLNGIDWGKTAVGFHSYHRDSSERMVELRNSKYPCINTEFMVGSNVIDGYEFHGTLMELLGISWLQWDIIDNRDKLTKLELVINDLKEKGVYWPDYEGDTGPPSTPQNVNAQAESSTSIKINWDASEDDTWLMGYNIFRDGEKIGATEEANYIDTGLTSGIEYSYTVSAYDFLGYESARSEPASALIEEDKIYPGDLVAYFPFDGSAEDATGNCEVTVVGSLTPAEGKIGQAYIYDGYENYTKVDWDSPIKGDQQSFTITAWIMSTDTSQYLYLLDYSHSHFRLSLQKEELVLHWRYGDDMDHFKLKYPFTEIGVFKHIAVTYNGESQEAHMYINGTLVAEDTSSHPTGIRSIKNPNIGKGFGIIDELRIYDQCLSGAHIRSLINTEDDEAPMVEDLSSWADYYTTYLTWSNPEGHDEEWEKISVVRKEGSAPENPEDGEKVYVDDGTELVDSNLSDGVYHYAVYTCIDLGAIMVYSRPERTSIEVPAIYNKDAVKIEADQDKRLVIGQNTEGDSYGLWNISSNHIGKGPGGKDTGLWIYSAIVGTNPDQVPTGSKILGARLVFNVEDSNFKANEPIEGNSINKAHSINIFRLTDPQGLGLPYYASESGIRVGLDYNYRDHRPGLNVPWVENIPLPENETESQEKTTANILQLLDGETPVDIIEFLPEAYENEQVDTLQFDITTAVQAWADGEDEQGLFISLDQGWINGETLKLSGITAEEEKTRPYIEIIYGTDDNSIDLTPPARVEGLSITPDSDRVTLNWQNPTDLDFEGVKIIRREGIVPFNSQDSDVVTFVDR
ncbi:MAG: LamG-like jellyroll fold domain-containing protein, partial [Halanaerobiales bacterium]